MGMISSVFGSKEGGSGVWGIYSGPYWLVDIDNGKRRVYRMDLPLDPTRFQYCVNRDYPGAQMTSYEWIEPHQEDCQSCRWVSFEAKERWEAYIQTIEIR